jgi:CHAD domain-containing protein
MSYRLKKGEKVREGMRRVVVEEADKALERLTSAKGNRDEAIHDARVCFKKIRAVLRLMRDPMGGQFQEENIFYRDLGRRLSSVRNNVAMIESLSKLKKRFADQLSARALRTPRRPLVESNARDKGEKKKTVIAVARGLRRGRRRMEQWPLGRDGFSDLAGGLKRTYKQGRNQFATSCQNPTVENLHEWRKRVKDFWYQLRILKNIWPGEVGQFADELQRLGDYLSDYHDLALLRGCSADNWKQIGEGTEIETLIALIDQRAAELRLGAELLGDRIYTEKPATFLRRLQCYWNAWREESKSQPLAARASKSELSD